VTLPDPTTLPDPLRGSSYPHTYWSTTNVAEAMPGVQTPLGWTVWAPICELGIRTAFAATGALPRAEVSVPDRPEDRTYNIFYGRAVLQVDFFYTIGNRLPGTDGAAVVKQWLDFVPPEFTAPSSRRRYPVIAARMPVSFASLPRRTRRVRAETDRWYLPELVRIATLGREDSRTAFVAGIARLMLTMRAQATTVLCGVQPVFDQLQKLITSVGGPSTGLLRGYGSHEETAMVADLWACSRDRLSLPEFQARHGYHGPGSGEIAARVWREDPSPLHGLIEHYRALSDDADPALSADAQIAERLRLEAELLASLPRLDRAKARAVLALAHTYLPLRGIGKVAFLQALDVSRAAARRYGTHLAEAGLIDEPDDVFFLTSEEVTGSLPGRVRDVVADRRATWEHYRTLDLPSAWQGEPTPVPLRLTAETDDEHLVLTGTGASPGVIEGTVRVVSDPGDDDIDPGDILVVRTTDPSWASIMFLSSAMVVDIGGLLSHAAIVGRELGVPCVMGTGNGTRVLRSGDRCRVDGNAGTVELLSRANTARADGPQLATETA
jgi:pyruvate,water dikinase